MTKTVVIDDFTDANFPASLTISNLTVAGSAGSTNTLSLRNANAASFPVPLRILNSVAIGAGGIAMITNSNLRVEGASGGSLTVNGNLTLFDGAVASALSILVLGSSDCLATGSVTVSGGNLFVTNATATATLDVRSGTLTLSSGTVNVDRLIMTNACGHFVRTGGTLIYASATLGPNLSAIGDGIPNGWKQQHGLDPFDPNLGSQDPDGDGFTNLQEFQAGTDPTNSASAFRISAVAPEGDEVRVTWMTGVGKTNALQRSAGDVTGGYSNNFADIFIATNTTDIVTNYLDVGAATNVPAFFYRVRLVP